MSNTVYDLDGIYFRVERNGKWQSLCVSDLTPEEVNYPHLTPLVYEVGACKSSS